MSTEASEPARGTAAVADADLDAGPIVFFDGVCGLCNHSVDLLLRWDRRAKLRYAPLQGETTRKLLGEMPADAAAWSVRLYDRGVWREQSSAALAILWIVGGFVGWISQLGWLVPGPLRDWVYRFVAIRRYRWFGEHASCRIPKPEERARFLP